MINLGLEDFLRLEVGYKTISDLGMANKKTNKNSKSKEKMQLAKDKNQLILAGIVLVLFVGVTIYNLASYVISQNPPAPPPQTEAQKAEMEKRLHSSDPLGAEIRSKDASGQDAASEPTVSPNATQSPADTTAVTPANPNDGANKLAKMEEEANAAPIPQQSGIDPLLLILAILIGGGIAYALMNYSVKALEDEGKNSGGKPKMSFAKNKNEAVLASVVLGLLVAVSLYNIAFYIKGQLMPPASNPNSQAELMAKSQQQNLESLNGDAPASEATNNDPLGAEINPGANQQNVQSDANDIYSKTLELQGRSPGSMPPSTAGGTGNGDEVEIMSKNNLRARSGRIVTIQVGESGRSNPFLPAAENVPPAALPKFSLLSPPESVSAGSDADNVMGTTISGILYDKYSPSAIITIGGTDYLVKRGDTINRYKILSITKEQVTVKLGNNIYKAGVGQILTQGTLNHNVISNLDRKFAGNSVSVNVRKKGK